MIQKAANQPPLLLLRSNGVMRSNGVRPTQFTLSDPSAPFIRPEAAERRIEFLYDVTSVSLVKRCSLEVEQAISLDPENQNEYWLLRLRTSRTLPHFVSTGSIRSFRFSLTAAADLLAGDYDLGV